MTLRPPWVSARPRWLDLTEEIWFWQLKTGTWTKYKKWQLEYLPACPLGSVPPGSHPRPGTAGGLYTPGGFENKEKKNPCSKDRFPAAWPPPRPPRPEPAAPAAPPAAPRRRPLPRREAAAAQPLPRSAPAGRLLSSSRLAAGHRVRHSGASTAVTESSARTPPGAATAAPAASVHGTACSVCSRRAAWTRTQPAAR